MSAGLRARFAVRRGGEFRLKLDLAIPPGRTVALLGPNGAGKSTAVAVLAGLLPVDTGVVELAGRVVDRPDAGILVPARERRVGVVFQDPLLFPGMSVLENVAFGLRSRGVGGEEARSRARSWLVRMDAGELESRRPPELSGGQAQRVALARALATEPDLLLLDEPLSALDVAGRTGLLRFLEGHLVDFPGPRVLITHDPAEAFRLADEIHVLEQGRVTQAGGAEDIRMRPRTPYVAALADSNLLRGNARGGAVETGGHTLVIADPDLRGPVRISIRPNAISVHRQEPGGSPRNRWSTSVKRVEDHGSLVRLLTGAPLPLMVDVTPAARRELGLEPGTPVWLSVKATEIGVEAESPGEPPVPGPIR